jgi:hypothetical protein
LIAQMKADSSRAIAVTTIVGRLPFRVSARKRPQSRICAFAAVLNLDLRLWMAALNDFTSLDVKLMAKDQDLGFQRDPRPEQ